MLQHFRYEAMFKQSSLPGWTFSFYYDNHFYTGEYMPDGTINWTSDAPANEERIKQQIHDLMTFHVYE